MSNMSRPLCAAMLLVFAAALASTAIVSAASAGVIMEDKKNVKGLVDPGDRKSKAGAIDPADKKSAPMKRRNEGSMDDWERKGVGRGK